MNHESHKSARRLRGFAALRECLLFILIGLMAACLLAAAGCGTPRGYDTDLTPGNGEEWADWGEVPAVQSVTQSRQGAKVRAAVEKHLARESWCAWCGTTNGLQVHHIIPLYRRPDLAATDANLVTLCRHDHLALGHPGGDTRKWIPNLRQLCNERLLCGPGTDAP